VSDFDHQDKQFTVFDLANDAVIADPIPPILGKLAF
jgi:hypothetical protein